MTDDRILITGASSDIGIALINRLLSRAKAPIVLAHYNGGAQRINDLQSQFDEQRIKAVHADFTDIESVSTMADDIEAIYGAPNAIVHLTALKLTYERFTKFDWNHFQSDMAVQLRSAVILLQRFLPKMAKMPRARLVFVLSSVTRGIPPKFMSMYTILKYAQLGLMRALASEYAGTGINVNAVSPSMIETQFLTGIPQLAVQMNAAANARGRNAKPEDVLGAIEFLLSPDSDYITGIDIPIAAGGVC